MNNLWDMVNTILAVLVGLALITGGMIGLIWLLRFGVSLL